MRVLVEIRQVHETLLRFETWPFTKRPTGPAETPLNGFYRGVVRKMNHATVKHISAGARGLLKEGA
jgi:hypothetical protein